VADRIHALLEAGAPAESIGVVVRDLGRYAVALRGQLGRLGIPFSCESAAGPPTGRGRRVHALLELLAHGGTTPAERWLEVLESVGRGARADLRLAFHAMGAARLADVARLDPDRLLGGRASYALPARRGLAEAEGGDAERGAPRARRRSVSAGLLRDTVAKARGLMEHFEAWPAQSPLADHRRRFRALFTDHLAWRREEERAELDRAGAELSARHPELGLGFDEWVLLLRRLLRGAGSGRLGGAGAGVQVLSVVEARARTFDHLFVLGVNRDGFPRPLTEDPLLPDSVRRAVTSVLPEMPVKARGFEEEHYLFAQLLAASGDVTLSWQVADDEGRARSPSPFIDRLRGAAVLGGIEDAPTLQAPPERAVGRPRTALEAAIAEGLHGHPARFARLLPLAAEERQRFDPAPRDAEADAAARLAVLGELAPAANESRVGPYLGFVGAATLEQDLRHRPLFVTQLESLARCPWSFFVTRLLGLEPAPDALDALPEASALLLGNVVHGTLEVLVRDAIGDGDPGGEGAPVAWPERERREQVLREVTDRVLAEEGVGPPAFAEVVVRAARPLVDAAREHGWPEPGSDVRCLDVESTSELEVPAPGGGTRTLHFRADRVDRVPGGERWVDYKCGRRTPGTKTKIREGLLRGVAQGTHLQAAAYAFASGGEGRYLFLDPDAAAPVYPIDGRDQEFRRHFDAALASLLAAFEQGTFVPRLVEPGGSGPSSVCQWCDVHEACLQGDAGARARIAAWAEAGRVESPAEEVALELWGLPERQPE
jgi:RecB family exonuclease